MALWSFVLAVLALLISLFSILLYYLDLPRLQVQGITPGITGTLDQKQVWHHKVASIEIVIANRGHRPALDCQGLVTFHGLPALKLYPQTREHTVDTSTGVFSVQPGARVRAVAAWNFQGPIIDGRDGYSLEEFLERAVPATVTITCGRHTVRGVLSADAARALLERHERQAYLGSNP